MQFTDFVFTDGSICLKFCEAKNEISSQPPVVTSVWSDWTSCSKGNNGNGLQIDEAVCLEDGTWVIIYFTNALIVSYNFICIDYFILHFLIIIYDINYNYLHFLVSLEHNKTLYITFITSGSQI